MQQQRPASKTTISKHVGHIKPQFACYCSGGLPQIKEFPQSYHSKCPRCPPANCEEWCMQGWGRWVYLQFHIALNSLTPMHRAFHLLPLPSCACCLQPNAPQAGPTIPLLGMVRSGPVHKEKEAVYSVIAMSFAKTQGSTPGSHRLHCFQLRSPGHFRVALLGANQMLLQLVLATPSR